MQTGKKWRNGLTLFNSITVYFLLFLNVVALYFVLSQNLMAGVQVPFYVIALPFVFIKYLPVNYEYYWIIFLVIAVLIAFILSSFDFYKYVRKKDERFGKFTELLVLTISFTYLTYFISMAVTSQQNPFGNPIGNTPTNYVLLSLLHAPVYEEIVYRVFLLGIPAFIVNFIYYREKIPWYRAFIGGKFQMNMGTIAFLLLSAFFFGSAHLVSWDISKFPSAFLAGIVLGFIFLRYGLYMSITMHFIIDFMGSYSYINGPLWIYLTIISALILLIWFVTGLPYYWIYLRTVFRPAKKQENNANKNLVLGYEIKCPYCGFDRFEVIDGKNLKCLRCGGIFQIKK